MIVVTTCPITKKALYISDIKPSLVKKGANGDWGYSPNQSQAIDLTPFQTERCVSDMNKVGRNPRVIEVVGYDTAKV